MSDDYVHSQAVPEWMVPGAKCHESYGSVNHSNWSGYIVAIITTEPETQIVFKRWQWRKRRWYYWVEPMWLINWSNEGGYKSLKPGPLPRDEMPRSQGGTRV